MQITYDGTSLVSSPFTVRRLTHENADSRVLNLQELARQRGGVLLNAEYKPKIIRIEGTITGTSNTDLEGNIDEFKELIARQGKNLDISYENGTRRFIATNRAIRIERDYYHLNYAPYEIEMLIPMGIGYDITTTTASYAGVTDLTYTDSVTIGGTVDPKVIITVSVTAASGVTAMFFLANGFKITLTQAIAATDVIIFNGETMKVTVNGVEVDYTGMFPNWVVGLNAFYLETTGTSITYDLTLTYTKNYL